MKKLMMTVVVTTATLSSQAGTATWAWPSASSDFFGAANWSEPENWQNRGIPAAGDEAVFSGSGKTWVRIPEAGTATFRKLTASSGDGVPVFFGGPINLSLNETLSPKILASKGVFFSDIRSEDMVNCDGGTTVYGKMDCDFLIGSDAQCTFTWDWTRRSDEPADGVRTYDFTHVCRPNYGGLKILFPKGMDAANGAWKTTTGSRYAIYGGTGPKGTELAAGAAVSSEAFPPGTFVRQIFDDSVIELSSAALSSSDGAMVSFSACRSRMDLHMDHEQSLFKATGNTSSLRLENTRTNGGDVNRLFLKLTPQNGSGTGIVSINGACNESTNVHPRVMLAYGESWQTYHCTLRLINGLIELQPTNDTNFAFYGGKMEIYGQNLASDGGNSRIHFDVPAGRRAVVDSVTKVKPAESYYGNPIAFKWGAGDLDLRLAVEDGSVMGLFTVREGTLGLTFAVPQTTLGKTIEVDANACLRLTAGTNRVNLAKVKFEKDATLNTVANEFGRIPCFEVTNDPEDGFNKGGTIVVSGNLSRLGAGDYPLWKAPTISAGTAAKWNVRFEDPDHPAKVSSLAAHARLDSASEILRLHVERSGMAVLVK